MGEPITYLSIDPGDSTGWCLFDVNGNTAEFGVCKSIDGRDGLYEFLAKVHPYPITTIICEDFRLFPWKSKEQSWSDLNTPRVIGVIEYWAYLTKRKLVMQSPQIKTVGYKWAGLTVPKNKMMSHSSDAIVHGIYFLQNMKIRTPQQGR